MSLNDWVNIRLVFLNRIVNPGTSKDFPFIACICTISSLLPRQTVHRPMTIRSESVSRLAASLKLLLVDPVQWEEKVSSRP